MELNHPAAAHSRPPVTEAALCAWVGQAHPGDRLVYHRGFLAIDAGSDSSVGEADKRHALRRVANRAWQLAQDGVVHLVQRRESGGYYTYFVVARPRPRAAGGALKAVLQQAGLSETSPAVRRSA